PHGLARAPHNGPCHVLGLLAVRVGALLAARANDPRAAGKPRGFEPYGRAPLRREAMGGLQVGGLVLLWHTRTVSPSRQVRTTMSPAGDTEEYAKLRRIARAIFAELRQI